MSLSNPFQGYLEVQQEIKDIAKACGREAEDIRLVVVSKGQTIEQMKEVYRAGGRHFGESRIQEALEKIPLLPADIEWHFIGKVQSNKAKKILTFFQWIHSIDTVELAEKIAALSQECGFKPSVLLQVNISGEATKQGLSPDEWEAHVDTMSQHPFLHLEGLMTMAPLTEDHEVIRSCFKQLRLFKDKLQQRFKNPSLFCQLSMGMSQDYKIAIQEGATLLRIGTVIFGQRSN